MQAMICEMCNGNDLVKQDGLYVCQYCGTKYTVDEARKLLGTVKIDKTEEKENLLILARRAREEGNSENAEEYYGMLLREDPDSWEAAFFQAYYQAVQCKVGEIAYYADIVGNSIETVEALIARADQEEKNRAVKTVIDPCVKIAEMFASAATNHCYKHISVDGAIRECVNTNMKVSRIIGKLETVVKKHCSDKNVLVELQKRYVSHLTAHSRFLDKEYLRITIARLSNEIQKVNTFYTAPRVNTGGCYVATAVYGSYDCPQVWTLRRFRDDILAETWYGRAFICVYYAISPTLVKWFGKAGWFRDLWKPVLDRMVEDLKEKGVKDTPYRDREG